MRIALILGLLGFLTSPFSVLAEEAIGRIKDVEGIAFIQRGYERFLCKPGDELFESDIVRTLDDGKIGFTLNDETAFALGPDTLVRIDRFAFDTNSYDGELQASLEMGKIAVRTGRLAKKADPRITIKTDQSILGVRGTQFLVGAL